MNLHRLSLITEPNSFTDIARCRGDAYFDYLWQDVSAAVYPTMGPNPNVPDYSGRNEIYTWTGSTVSNFVRKNGVWRFRYDSTGIRTTIGTMDDVIGTGDVTILLGYEKTDATLRDSGAFGSNDSSTVAEFCGTYLPWSNGYAFFDHGGVTNGTSRVNTNTHGDGAITPGDDDYAFVAGVNRGMEIWQNGKIIAQHSGFTARTASGADLFKWGNHGNLGADLADYKYMIVYKRVLSPEEIRLVAHFPKAMLVPRANIITSAVVGDLPESASNTLAMTDLASAARDYEEPVSEDLGLTSSVVHTADYPRSITDTMSIVHQADGRREPVENTMTLVDSVIHLLSVGDFKPIEHTLGLTQLVITGSERTVVDPMTLVQTLEVIGPIVKSVQSNLTMQSFATFCFGAPWAAIEIEHTLDITDIGGIGWEESVTDVMTLTDEAAKVNATGHWLSIVQTVSAGIGKFVFNTLEMTQQIGSESIYGRVLTHADILQDAMAYYIITPCSVKQYNRFEGSGPGDGIPEAPLTFDADFVLETLSGSKVKLQMRSPEPDDKQRIGFSRVNRETSGGELNVYSDPNWPKIKNLLFTIVAISDGTGNCPDKLTDLMDFLQTNLGLEILIHDWEGISWRGVITTPNEVATEDRDGWWTFSFEFSGEDLDGSQGDQNLAISDTVFLNADWGRGATHAMALEQTIVVSGILQNNIADPLGVTDTVNAEIDNVILLDDFSGSSGTDLHGQSPDIGASSWSAHTNYKADGSQTAINSGAYYPFAPQHWTNYEITWKPRSMTHGDGLASWFFLGEGLNSDPDNTSSTAWGRFDPTTLKSGFGIRQISASQLNTCRMGDETDGLADNVDMTDATLKAMTVDIDLRIDLDTSGGANTWMATWYAKDPVDSVWTQVRAATKLLSEDITMVGWSNDNTTTVVDMLSIEVKEKVSQ